jgi:hypothetical protein
VVHIICLGDTHGNQWCLDTLKFILSTDTAITHVCLEFLDQKSQGAVDDFLDVHPLSEELLEQLYANHAQHMRTFELEYPISDEPV